MHNFIEIQLHLPVTMRVVKNSHHRESADYTRHNKENSQKKRARQLVGQDRVAAYTKLYVNYCLPCDLSLFHHVPYNLKDHWSWSLGPFPLQLSKVSPFCHLLLNGNLLLSVKIGTFLKRYRKFIVMKREGQLWQCFNNSHVWSKQQIYQFHPNWTINQWRY